MLGIFTAVAAALFITLSTAMAGTVKPRDGWAVIDTHYAFSALVERVEAAVKAEKMGLVTSASASEGAKAAGVVIPGNRVIGVFRKRCRDNLTRENVMKVVANLDFEIDTLIPGIRIKTTPTDFFPIEQVQMMRFTGERWQMFGPILDGHAGQVVPSSN